MHIIRGDARQVKPATKDTLQSLVVEFVGNRADVYVASRFLLFDSSNRLYNLQIRFNGSASRPTYGC